MKKVNRLALLTSFAGDLERKPNKSSLIFIPDKKTNHI